MEIIKAYATGQVYYRSPKRIPVRKLILHSVGCAQPSAAVFARLWQTAQYFAHAVLDAAGAVYQVLPWDYLAPHVGPANAYSIGVEMTEPDCIRYTGGANFVCGDTRKAIAQVSGTYRTAVELFAQLCGEFGLDPYTDILSHHEAYLQGIGTNHGDPEHLWRQLGTGFTMDGFRKDVFAEMHRNEEEDEDMAIRFKTVDDVPKSLRKETQELIDSGALKGKGGDAGLDVTEDMLRCMIINKRYADGLAGK